MVLLLGEWLPVGLLSRWWWWYERGRATEGGEAGAEAEETDAEEELDDELREGEADESGEKVDARCCCGEGDEVGKSKFVKLVLKRSRGVELVNLEPPERD